ncbi:hypothetical protein [Streptomyces sp. NPDC054865]
MRIHRSRAVALATAVGFVLALTGCGGGGSGGAGPSGAGDAAGAADPSHMPNADGVSLPLATTGSVARPRVGLYHFTARDSYDTL